MLRSSSQVAWGSPSWGSLVRVRRDPRAWGLAASAVPIAGLGEWGKASGKSGGKETDEERLERREKQTKLLEAQEKGAYLSSSIVATVVPWGTLAAAGGYLTGLAFKVAILTRKKGDLALKGDEKAIAGFMKKSAKWSGEKRKRVALRLKKQLDGLQKRGKKKVFLGKKLVSETDTNRVRVAKTKMKIAALVALEAEARKDRKKPLVANDPATTPELVEANPVSSMPDATEAAYSSDSTTAWWIGGGVAATIILAAALARSRRRAA